MIDYISTFIFFFAVIDPVGTVPVFIATTKDYDLTDKRKIAFKASFVAAGVLLLFVVAGELLLNGMSVPLYAFQIAGGIVLFLFALSMIFGPGKPGEEIKMAKKKHEIAIFPLAIPSIASPGAMLAAVLLTENKVYSIFEQMQVAFTMLIVLAIVLLFMLLSGRITKFIGESGAQIISRVMGLILASVAVANVLEGVKAFSVL